MVEGSGSGPLRVLYDIVQKLRRDPAGGSAETKRTARLMSQGRSRMAAKVGEEAIEIAIEAMRGDRQAVILETADLLYNLTVLLADLDISLDDVWAELRRREETFGIAGKIPKEELLPPPAGLPPVKEKQPAEKDKRRKRIKRPG